MVGMIPSSPANSPANCSWPLSFSSQWLVECKRGTVNVKVTLLMNSDLIYIQWQKVPVLGRRRSHAPLRGESCNCY
jgi:hypothetical protein